MRVYIFRTPYAWAYGAYLNGDFVEKCVEANDVDGYVVVDCPTPENPYRRERREGTVVIVGPNTVRATPFPRILAEYQSKNAHPV